jgi:3-hydroxyisobutyrate dehydrogenase-like beta-hydroxyacid dehydrogenase
MNLEQGEVFSILARFAPGLAARENGFLHHQHAPAMFAVRDLVKDLDLGLREYGEAGATTPLTEKSRELYTETMRESADLDISAIVSLPRAG